MLADVAAPSGLLGLLLIVLAILALIWFIRHL
jgi:hypothetical protein